MATLADALRGYTLPTESALADPIKEHFRTLPQQLATNQAALDSAIGSWNKTDFATGQPNPNYRPEAIQELTQLMPNIGALTAWHGTPHKIVGNFDISKVGTGEGAQAYGHGMYFAENPEVSETYRHAKQVVKYEPTIEKFTNGPNYFMNDAGNYMKVRDYVKNDVPVAVPKEEYLQKFNEVRSKYDEQPHGNLYKVDIPDEHIPNMLDWDKPISQQPNVIERLKAINPKELDKLGINPDFTRRSTGKELTGESLYDVLTTHNSQKGASKFLANQGIPGIRYLDQGSRSVTGGELIGITKTPQGYVSKVKVENRGGAGFSTPTQQFTTSTPFKTEAEAQAWANEKIGGGTSNFVVFDPSTVKILEENSKPVSRKALIEEQVNKLKD